MIVCARFDERSELERVKGIEPSWPAWEAGALPLCYTRHEKIGYDFRICEFKQEVLGLTAVNLLPRFKTAMYNNVGLIVVQIDDV